MSRNPDPSTARFLAPGDGRAAFLDDLAERLRDNPDRIARATCGFQREGVSDLYRLYYSFYFSCCYDSDPQAYRWVLTNFHRHLKYC